MLVQKIYISILNFIYKKTFLSKISEKLRNKLLFLSTLILSYFYLTRAASDFNFIFADYKRIVLGIITFIIILLSINQEIKEIKIDFYNVLYFIVGLSLFGFSCYYLDTYKFLFLGFSMLVLYPCLYLIWNTRKDWNTLFTYLSYSSMIISLFYYIMFFKYANNGVLINSSGRLTATISHQNDFSFIYVSSLVSAIYLIYTNRKNIPVLLFSSLIFSISIVNIMMSKCRASFLAIIAILVCYLVFMVKQFDKNIIKENLKYSLLVILSICILIPATSVVNDNLKEKSIISMATVENNVNGDSSSSDGIDNDIVEDMESYDDENMLSRMSVDNKGSLYDTLNALSTGRLSIWKAYLDNSTLFGNPYDGLQDQINVYPHNVLVDVIHRYGFIVGGIFTIWFIYNAIYSLIILFNKKYSDGKYLFLAMLVFSYFIIAMLDTVSVADGFYLPYCFYVSLGLLCKPKIDKPENGNEN